MSGFVASALNLLSGLAAGLAAGALHGALLWQQVRVITGARPPRALWVVANAWLRMAAGAGLLLLGARLGLVPAVAAVTAFLVTRTWWLRRIAA